MQYLPTTCNNVQLATCMRPVKVGSYFFSQEDHKAELKDTDTAVNSAFNS